MSGKVCTASIQSSAHYSMRHLHPEWRLGQALYNTLARAHPDIAAAISQTQADPFYDDERVPAFWSVLLVFERTGR